MIVQQIIKCINLCGFRLYLNSHCLLLVMPEKWANLQQFYYINSSPVKDAVT